MDKIIDFNINEEEIDQKRIREIEDQCRKGVPLNIEDVNLLLTNLSYQVRKKIAEHEGIDMKEYSYPYKCDLAQSMIYYYLNEINIKVNPVNTNEVINGVSGHSLTIASINTIEGEKQFLVDPTYLQFFTKENCDPNKFVIINDMVCISPDPGYYVVRNNNENLIMPLLTNGFIEFSEDVAKAYGDSFFQTQQGINPNQIDHNVASGSSYIKWFNHTTSNLSKSEEELTNMNLLFTPSSIKSTKRK